MPSGKGDCKAQRSEHDPDGLVNLDWVVGDQTNAKRGESEDVKRREHGRPRLTTRSNDQFGFASSFI
jgi:hypothetical protein